MSIADRFTQAPYAPAGRRARHDPPKGLEPGVKYEANRPVSVALNLREIPEDEQAWRVEIGRVFPGLPIPDERRVEISSLRYWGDPAAPMVYVRFDITDRDVAAGDNLDELVAAILKAKPPRAAKGQGIPATQTVVWSDWQLFKSAGDGFEGTVRRIRAGFAATLAARAEWSRQGFAVDDLLIGGNGDIVEGCAIYPHQLMHIDGGGRAQRNAGRRLIVEGVRTLAPKYGTVRVSVVGGNHGEHRIEGRAIDDQDNGDIEVFESAFDVLNENTDAFGHCALSVPPNALIATIDVQGWIFAHQHGHLDMGGTSPEAKMHGWFKQQAAAKTPAGDAHILATSHYHHARTADWGANDRDRSGCYWIQSAALDGGSPQFTKRYGYESAPSVTTWLTTPDQRIARIRTVQL